MKDPQTQMAASLTELDATRRELQRCREELAASKRELQRFTQVAAHDMKEPLRMISIYLSLLSKKYQGQLDAEADEFIGYAVGGAKRLSTLVESLARLAKSGHDSVELTPTDSNEVAREVIHDFGVLIDEKGAKLRVEGLPALLCDRAQLRQLLQNLIGNALKFSGEAAPEIEVSAEATGNMWRFSVKDNGIGIAPALLPNIFEPFVRGHARSTYRGDGIGLSICKNIVEKHGGRIWIESEERKGSTFYFTLPRQT